jgi:hypothetical protein
MAAAVAQPPWTLETRRFGVSVLPFTPLIPGASLFAEELLLFVCQGLSPRLLFRRPFFIRCQLRCQAWFPTAGCRARRRWFVNPDRLQLDTPNHRGGSSGGPGDRCLGGNGGSGGGSGNLGCGDAGRGGARGSGYGGRRADTRLGGGEHSGSGRSNDKHLGTREPGVCARCSHLQLPTCSRGRAGGSFW